MHNNEIIPFQTDTSAGGNHEREREQDHYLCGDQKEV